jgi:hypothetical protein
VETGAFGYGVFALDPAVGQPAAATLHQKRRPINDRGPRLVNPGWFALIALPAHSRGSRCRCFQPAGSRAPPAGILRGGLTLAIRQDAEGALRIERILLPQAGG